MSFKYRKDHWWLLPAPIVLTLLDMALTLAGQYSDYESSGYSHVNEVNPVGKLFLHGGPAVFIIGIVLWIALYSLATLFLSKYLAMVLSSAVQIGHTWGVSTWLPTWAGVILWIVSLGVLGLIWIWVRTKIDT